MSSANEFYVKAQRVGFIVQFLNIEIHLLQLQTSLNHVMRIFQKEVIESFVCKFIKNETQYV